MLAGSTPASPARPVADAPVADLADAEGLAKGWLITLVAGAPLAQAASLPTAELAREAPALCSAMVAALASEDALGRLRPEGDLGPLAARAGRLAGAADPAGAAGALAALRGVLWNELLVALRRPEPALVADLAARLGLVCDTVAAGALAQVAAPPAPAPMPLDQPGPEPAPVSAPHLAPVPDPAPVAEAPPVPADVFPQAATLAPEDRHEPWATAVVRRMERLVTEGVPSALLAVDVDDADRLLAADLHGAAREALDRAERALRDELRPGDSAVRERDGRLWIVAGATDLEGARALSRRLVHAVGALPPLEGAPLRVSIGIAVSPDDGMDAASLVAHADEGVFAARAAGVPIA